MWLYHRVMSPNDADGMANSVDPDQTAPLGAVWSGSALFAQAYLSENLGSLRYSNRLIFGFYMLFKSNSVVLSWCNNSASKMFSCKKTSRMYSTQFSESLLLKSLFEPYHEKTCLCHMQTTKVHPCSLISAFVVRCIDSIIPLVSIPKISSLYLASVTAQASLNLPWSQKPKITSLVTRLI